MKYFLMNPLKDGVRRPNSDLREERTETSNYFPSKSFGKF